MFNLSEQKHPYFRDILEFWEENGEIRIKRTRGVDGTKVSYPGADEGETPDSTEDCGRGPAASLSI